MDRNRNQTHLFAKLAGKTIRSVARLGRRYSSDREGVTAIEFSLVAMPFLMIVFGILEFGLAFFVNRILDNAVMESARMIRTGQAQEAGFTADSFKEDICTNLPGFLCLPDNFEVDVTKYETFGGLDAMEPMVDDDGDLRDDYTFDMGCASEIIVARVIYRWPMFTALLNVDAGDTGTTERLLQSTSIFRNEPFPNTPGDC